MWDIFKKVEWREETLPLMKGQAGGLQVLVRNFPTDRKSQGSDGLTSTKILEQI